MMLAASTAWGSRRSRGVSSNSTSSISAAVNTPTMGVRAPLSTAIAEREKLAATGRPPLKAAARLAAP